MKLTLIFWILCFLIVLPVSGDIYTYTDKNGNLHIVDDPDKVPDEYLLKQNNLELQSKEYTSLENKLTSRIVVNLNYKEIDKVFFSHIFNKKFLAFTAITLIGCLILLFLIQGKTNKILFIFTALIVFQMIYFIYWGPDIQKKSSGFAIILTSVLKKSGNQVNVTNYNRKIYEFSHSPLPFSPISFLFDLYSIMKLHETLFAYFDTDGIKSDELLFDSLKRL